MTSLLTTRFSLPAPRAARIAGPVGEYFLFTLAAQLTTLPVILYHFQRLSLVSFLANPFLLPAQPAVMVLSGLAVLVGDLWLPLGRPVAALAWLFAAYTIQAVEFFARFPAAELPIGRLSLAAVVLFYALLFGLTFRRTFRRTFGPSRWKDRLQAAYSRLRGSASARRLPLLTAGILGLAALALFTWWAVLATPDGRLHLVLLDVNGGEALLLTSPSGERVLLNGGTSPNRLSDALGRRLPLGARRLDWLVVGGVSNEQLSALPTTLERFPPQNVLWSGAPAGSRAARDLQRSLGDLGAPIHLAEPGQKLDLGDGATLEVLATGSDGAILYLTWRSFTALLPLGANEDNLAKVQSGPLPASLTALFLGNGGSKDANPPAWLARWQPQVVLVSVAVGDARGRPEPEALADLEGYTLLRTDQNGWVELTTDGERLWVEGERN